MAHFWTALNSVGNAVNSSARATKNVTSTCNLPTGLCAHRSSKIKMQLDLLFSFSQLGQQKSQRPVLAWPSQPQVIKATQYAKTAHVVSKMHNVILIPIVGDVAFRKVPKFKSKHWFQGSFCWLKRIFFRYFQTQWRLTLPLSRTARLQRQLAQSYERIWTRIGWYDAKERRSASLRACFVLWPLLVHG